MLTLRELVDRYRAVAGEFGRPVALSAFGLNQAETERLFSAFDEDYHISRFFHFTEEPSRVGPSDASSTTYSINGFPATHVSLDSEIESLL